MPTVNTTGVPCQQRRLGVLCQHRRWVSPVNTQDDGCPLSTHNYVCPPINTEDWVSPVNTYNDGCPLLTQNMDVLCQHRRMRVTCQHTG